MATIVNGARIEWDGYEFGRFDDGTLLEVGTLEDLKDHQEEDRQGSYLMFRARYVTEWWEVTDAPDD